jgi:allantoicase
LNNLTALQQMSLKIEQYINLADDKLGAEALYATDDFFADKSR